jgi:hypothetical protein
MPVFKNSSHRQHLKASTSGVYIGLDYNIPAITHVLRGIMVMAGMLPPFKIIILPTVIADARKHQHSRHHSLPQNYHITLPAHDTSSKIFFRKLAINITVPPCVACIL